MVFLAGRRAGRAGMDGWAAGIFHVAVTHGHLIFAGSQMDLAGRHSHNVQYFLAAEFDDALGRLAVNAHLTEQLQASLKNPVGQIVIGGHQRIGVKFDPILFHDVLDASGEHQVIIAFFHVGAALCSFGNFYKPVGSHT